MQTRIPYAAVLVLLVGVSMAGAVEITPLLPTGTPVLAPVGTGDKAKDYVVVGPEGAEFQLSGSGTLSGWIRVHLDPGNKNIHAAVVQFEGVPGLNSMPENVFKPSSKWAYDDGRAGQPSGGKKLLPVQIPAGAHTLRISAANETLLLRLTWEPDQPKGKAQPALIAASPAKPKKKKSPWQTSVKVGLETIYDDNFLRYSDDFQTDLLSGEYPHKYQAEQIDSHIFAPSLDMYVQRKMFDMGKTRARFKVKSWRYVQGFLKTNTSFDYQIRQFLSGGRSLEVGYNYAPEQYIRELSDHPPGTGVDDETPYGEFRYTRNVFTMTWRQKLHKKVSLKLFMHRSLRYYNKPYMENDIKDLGLRTTVSWKAHKEWTITADYGYADAPARGWDTIGETRENSDDSNPSYNQDMYQLAVAWSPKWAKPVFNKVDVRGRYQVAWFTSPKSVEDDPYHAGRIDRVYQTRIAFNRKLPHGVDMQVGFQYAMREVESPWDGDISEDKNYDQRRYWIGLTYKL
jgi:hypothetical protein